MQGGMMRTRLVEVSLWIAVGLMGCDDTTSETPAETSTTSGSTPSGDATASTTGGSEVDDTSGVEAESTGGLDTAGLDTAGSDTTDSETTESDTIGDPCDGCSSSSSGDPSGCVDDDADGYGTDCEAGPDCDDADATVWSDCGAAVYVFGDHNTPGFFEVSRASLATGIVTDLALSEFSGGDSIFHVAATPDGAQIAVVGIDDPSVLDAEALVLYDADGTNGTVVSIATSPGHNFFYPEFSPDGAWLAYLSDPIVGGATRVWVAPVDGATTPFAVTPVPGESQPRAVAFAWSPDLSGPERTVVYVAESGGTHGSLWSVDVAAAAPTPTAIVGLDEVDGQQGVQDRYFEFDSEGRVYFLWDSQTNNRYRLYRAAVDGTSREQVPHTLFANAAGEASVGAFAISHDGTRLAFAVESPTQYLYQVYVLDLVDPDAEPTLVSGVSNTLGSGIEGPDTSTTGPNPIRWSADDSILAVSAKWNDEEGVYIIDPDGLGGLLVLECSPHRVQMAGSAVVVHADLDDPAGEGIFAISDLSTAFQDPADVQLIDLAGGGSIEGFAVAP